MPRKMIEMPDTPCLECGTLVRIDTMRLRAKFGAGRVFCCPEHMNESVRKMKSANMAKIARKYSSARMLANNPMKDPEVRRKMSDTLRAIGHRPPVQGGNGRGLTEPQQAMLSLLGNCATAEYVVKTGMGKTSGYPQHYKIDIAIPEALIAIEIDGGSHNALAVRLKDDKKTALLNGFGWTVLRFWNQEVMDDLEGCVQTVLSTISRLKDTTPT